MKYTNDDEPEYNMGNYIQHLTGSDEDREWIAEYHRVLAVRTAEVEKRAEKREDAKWAAAVGQAGTPKTRAVIEAALLALRVNGWKIIYPDDWPGICKTCKSIVEEGTYHSAFNGNQMFACKVNDLPTCLKCNERLAIPNWRESWWSHDDDSSCEGVSMWNGGFGWDRADHLITKDENAERSNGVIS